MARLNIKYVTPKVFNIDQSKRYLLPLSAEDYGGINILRITFDGIVDGALSAAEAEDFIISMSGGPMTPTSDAIVYAGVDHIDIVVSRQFFCDETGSITYTPGTYRIVSTEGHKVRKFTLAITGIEACTTTSTTTTEGFEDILYGLLYNWYAATDARNIANTGWHVPTDANWNTLFNYVSDINTCSNELKEIGTMYWNDDLGTNIVNFNARGSGYRDYLDGSFNSLKILGTWWSSTTSAFPTSGKYTNTFSGADDFNISSFNKKRGIAVRLIRDSTTLTHGQIGTYTGNDGKIYRTICIGTQEWLADSLIETKYRDGSDIPEVTDGAAWTVLTTGALCAYNNDWGNV